ncbi:MAG TPA: AzlD domain-containing protein [Acidimicrobiia bacterium]|jgi:branched-subunit amino acid transport protein|nr:AzlD domain-containing protein [Acidimicrobiia bacterium]
MSLLTLLLVAAITYISRVAAMALLPPPAGRTAEVVDRLPAPLFAALAAYTVMSAETGPTDPALLGAAACALLTFRRRSMLVTLAAGLAGYLLIDWLL